MESLRAFSFSLLSFPGYFDGLWVFGGGYEMGLATFFFLVCYLLGPSILLFCEDESQGYYWLLYKCYAYSYLKCKHAFAECFGFVFVLETVNCRL